MATIILTGGGTAGHVMPNIALLPELAKYFDRIYYMGADGIEKTIAKEYGITFVETTAIKLNRKQIFSNLKIPFVLSTAIKKAKEKLLTINPDVVFSKGGYVSLPCCYAAKSLGIPVIIHESDCTLGLANKLVSSFAKLVITSNPTTSIGQYIGNPIRQELLKGNASTARTTYKLSSKPTLLFMGGSMGAQAINEVVYSCLDSLTKNYNVIHLVGKNIDKSIQCVNYTPIEFSQDMASLYAVADMIISRAGASSLSEIMALGKRNIIIPLPKGASRGDQEENAKYFSNLGAINVLKQSELTPAKLLTDIENLFKLPPPKRIGNNVNAEIVKAICECKK